MLSIILGEIWVNKGVKQVVKFIKGGIVITIYFNLIL